MVAAFRNSACVLIIAMNKQLKILKNLGKIVWKDCFGKLGCTQPRPLSSSWMNKLREG